MLTCTVCGHTTKKGKLYKIEAKAREVYGCLSCYRGANKGRRFCR